MHSFSSSAPPIRLSVHHRCAGLPPPLVARCSCRDEYPTQEFCKASALRTGRKSSFASSLRVLLSTPCFCSQNNRHDVEGNVFDARDMKDLSANSIGSDVENGGIGSKSFSSKELVQKLKKYGVAGILSYGLLNTAYYLTTFLFFWFYFSPNPGRMGYLAAVKRFLKIMVMVWAGSQVTKIVRAGGALALAPVVAKGLTWFTVKFNFESEGKAFAAIVGLCLLLALFLFLGLTLLSA